MVSRFSGFGLGANKVLQAGDRRRARKRCALRRAQAAPGLLPSARSKANGRPAPGRVPRPRPRKRLAGIDPSFAGIAPRTPAAEVQQSLAAGVEAKKPQYFLAIRGARLRITANQLVVGHPAIGQRNRTPGSDLGSRSTTQALAEHHCIQQIAFQPYVARHRAIVERAGQRRNEVDAAKRPSLQKAAAGYLDKDFQLRR